MPLAKLCCVSQETFSGDDHMIVRRSGLLVHSGTFGCTFTSSAAILSAESKPPNSEMQLVLLDCGLVIAGHFGILEESEHEIRS